MILGIDASSIRAGGGVTHLVELLAIASPEKHGFSRIVIWGGRHTLSKIQDRPWLEKSHQPILERKLPFRIMWQSFTLSRLAWKAGCDVLFVPGGTYVGGFHPVVTFNQNLLPFDLKELMRFGRSVETVKGLLLRWSQGRSFRRADGVIFLTRNARDVVMRVIGRTAGPTTIIPHGVDSRFHVPPRPQFPIEHYSTARPYRLLYLSTVTYYKHQWHVADAVARLRAEGVPIELEIAGPSQPRPMVRLTEAMRRLDPSGEFIRYVGPVPHEELPERYVGADAFVFASSCETFGQIVTEAMLCGLPIVSSNRSAMPELVGDAGLYFDPEDPEDIARALRELVESAPRRDSLARAAFERAQTYSWSRCAEETLEFLATAARPGPGGRSVAAEPATG